MLCGLGAQAFLLGVLCGMKGAVEDVHSVAGRGVGLCVHSGPCSNLTQDDPLGLSNCSKMGFSLGLVVWVFFGGCSFGPVPSASRE